MVGLVGRLVGWLVGWFRHAKSLCYFWGVRIWGGCTLVHAHRLWLPTCKLGRQMPCHCLSEATHMRSNGPLERDLQYRDAFCKGKPQKLPHGKRCCHVGSLNTFQMPCQTLVPQPSCVMLSVTQRMLCRGAHQLHAHRQSQPWWRLSPED